MGRVLIYGSVKIIMKGISAMEREDKIKPILYNMEKYTITFKLSSLKFINASI
ncbi:hypothetical protein RhiirA1_410110 [Rhizophagus irregularis]|uniref:Uncharacterized protein n=1 Tax=Rhizophagus irregularis TaxID=588596 RepID=A0A2N0SE00_9GLOM|nr:hypothetical protein RhiirA1_410110 [Rhizophagus irregularis]GBC12780.1 hypothetical protein RIR_e16764_A0A2I1GDT9_9GLOM [Rhizophagus irregularis DAOM 181602=DAOM 197198]